MTTNNIRVQSASIGKQLRGARHGAFRPDLVILDDLESSKNTNTKELRDKNLHWFNSVIMPIGDITKTAFIYMGTLVHGQGLLPAVLARSDFKGKIYSAIVSEPEYPELWDKLESILRDQENTDREHDAEVFYYSNKERMDKGAVTLWNDRFTYFELMKIKVNVGSRAFGSEYLNRPTDDETAIFKKNYMQFYDNKDLYYADGRPMNLEVYGFWDIAIGKNDRSDYNAIVTIGRDKRTGILYILDAWAGKVPMHKALEVAIEKIQEYGHSAFGVETVQAQYDMYRQLRERLTKLGCYKTRVLAVNPKGKKEDRIEQLEPLVEQGVIRFRQNQRLLLEMLEQFPNHDHDDLPDALASVVEIAGKQRKRTYYKKPSGF
ncbi:TPA: phage terminase large subunit [Clostridium botulinum]